MPSSTESWGIEVGSSAIKGIRLRKDGNEVAVTDFAIQPFKKVLTTPDLDVDESIRVNLTQFMADHPVGNATVVVSVPGHRAFARFAKLPPVEPKKIPDIVRFEAVQQIPFQIDQVEWDYQTFANPESPDVEVGIFAITKERMNAWLSNFNAVELPVHRVTLSPVAVYNALAYDRGLDASSPGIVMLDIGTVATELIAFEQGRIWLRTIPIGGNHFTETLVRSFKLSFSKAEKLKREAATSKYARQIFQAMRPVFVNLVQEIQKSLGYYQALNRDAQLNEVLGMGCTFRLPGLQKFLKQQLQLEFRRLDEYARISPEGRDASTFAANALSLAPAYGLALQGLGMEDVTCNLLPANIVRQQVWRQKQKWMAGAAAAVVIASGLAFGKLHQSRSGQGGEIIYPGPDGSDRNVEHLIVEANRRQGEWNQEAGESKDPRVKIEQLRGILEHRDVMMSILHDIDDALASVGPQDALKRGDWDAIRAIPRGQRREVAIESIDIRFDVKEDSRRGPPGMGMAGGGFSGPGRFNDDSMEDDASRQIHVTIRVTSPHAQAADLMNDTVLKWFQDHREIAGRGYVINTDDDVLGFEVEPYHSGGGRGGSSPRGVGGSPLSVGGPPRGGPMLPGGAGPAGGLPAGSERFQPGIVTGGRDGGRRTVSGASDDPKDLMPVHPLADEDRSDDWMFTVKFRVDLQDSEPTDAEGDVTARAEGGS